MIYVLVLTVVTAVWGWTFVVVKDSITSYPVAPFLALRFGLAVLVLLILSRRLPSRCFNRKTVAIAERTSRVASRFTLWPISTSACSP